jgi:hypothetical protein
MTDETKAKFEQSKEKVRQRFREKLTDQPELDTALALLEMTSAEHFAKTGDLSVTTIPDPDKLEEIAARVRAEMRDKEGLETAEAYVAEEQAKLLTEDEGLKRLQQRAERRRQREEQRTLRIEAFKVACEEMLVACSRVHETLKPLTEIESSRIALAFALGRDDDGHVDPYLGDVNPTPAKENEATDAVLVEILGWHAMDVMRSGAICWEPDGWSRDS